MKAAPHRLWHGRAAAPLAPVVFALLTAAAGLEDVDILVSLPLSNSDMGLSMQFASQHAVDLINQQQVLLPGRRIVLHIYDDHCDDSLAVTAFLTQFLETSKQYLALGGLACSATAKSVAPITDIFRLPLVSWGASSGELSSRERFPKFFRTRMPEGDAPKVKVLLMQEFGWREASVLKGDPARFGTDSRNFVDLATAAGIRVRVERFMMIPEDAAGALNEIVADRARIIVMYTYEDPIRYVICQAKQDGLSGFIFVSKMTSFQFWMEPYAGMDASCDAASLGRQIEGHLKIGGMHLRPDLFQSLDCFPGTVADDFAKDLTAMMESEMSQGRLDIAHAIAFNAVDGVCLLAMAFRAMFDDGYSIEDMQGRNSSTYDAFAVELSRIFFQGVSGRISFKGNGDPVGQLIVKQTVAEADRTLGYYDAASGRVDLTQLPVWPNGKANISALFPACGPGLQPRGIDCEVCEPGTAKRGTGSAPCVDCAAGWFASQSGASECTECESKSFAHEEGASSCTECPLFSSSDGVQCFLDWWSLLPMGLAFVAACFASFVFFVRIRSRHKICDLSQGPDGTRVSLLAAHRINYSWRYGLSTNVVIMDTGLHDLDGWDKGLRARVTGPKTLLILDKAGAPLQDERLEGSKGTLHLPFVSNYLDTTARLVHLPAIFVVIAVSACLTTFGIISVAVSGPLAALVSLAGVVVGIVCAIIKRTAAWRSKTPMEMRIHDFRHILLKDNPRPVPATRGPGRAIAFHTLEMITDHFRSFICNRTMYYICNNIVFPLTEPYRLSFAEVAGPQQVTWFASHYWGARFRETVASLAHHADLSRATYGILQSNYWICTFANNQWDIASEMGTGVTTSSFYLALQSESCHGTTMIVNDTGSPLSRVWCLFEASITCQLSHTRPGSFHGLLLCTPSGVLNVGQGTMETGLNLAQQLITLDMRNAATSRQVDKDMILDFVGKMEGGLDEVNRFVVTGIEKSLAEMHRCFETNFEGMMKDLRLCSTSTSRDPSLIRRHPTANSLALQAAADVAVVDSGAEVIVT